MVMANLYVYMYMYIYTYTITYTQYVCWMVDMAKQFIYIYIYIYIYIICLNDGYGRRGLLILGVVGPRAYRLQLQDEYICLSIYKNVRGSRKQDQLQYQDQYQDELISL
jgi:hypothetical protein